MGDVNKLPVWAQEHIKNLEMQRDSAIRTLNEFQDSQTKSRVWVDEMVCIGEETGPTTKRHYLQTRSVYFLVGKSEVSILLRDENTLDISVGSHALLFHPVASNVIRIEEPRR